MSRRDRRPGGERTRARILEVALRLFAEHGQVGTTTRMVAQEAQVNVGTLAYHFEGKVGLYQAVVDELFEVLFRDLRLEVPEPLDQHDPALVVTGLVRSLWSFASTHRMHVRLLQRITLDVDTHATPSTQRSLDALRERAEALIGLFRPDWPDNWRSLFLLSFVHVVFGYALQEPDDLVRLLGHPDDVDEAVVGWLSLMAYATLIAPAHPALHALRDAGVDSVLPRPVHEA